MSVDDPGMIAANSGRTVQEMIQQIRVFMRDFPELNRLVAGAESGDRFIAWAIQNAISDWNSTPPLLTSVTISNHPAPHLLRDRAVVDLLTSIGILQTRNHLSYSDGQGASINASDKAPALQGWSNMLRANYEQQKQKMKML